MSFKECAHMLCLAETLCYIVVLEVQSTMLHSSYRYMFETPPHGQTSHLRHPHHLHANIIQTLDMHIDTTQSENACDCAAFPHTQAHTYRDTHLHAQKHRLAQMHSHTHTHTQGKFTALDRLKDMCHCKTMCVAARRCDCKTLLSICCIPLW